MKIMSYSYKLLLCASLILTTNSLKANEGFRVALSAVDTDSDSDGLVDSVETNTGFFTSLSNTGTNPDNADTDADGVPDGLEVKEGTSPVNATKFNSFSMGLVAYYPFNGNANDCSGNQRHGIVSGNVQLAPDFNDIPDACYDFDGNDNGTEGKLATIEVESPFLKTWEDFTMSRFSVNVRKVALI
ncbi:MAG: hypothetical protein ACK49N_09565 [Verrucomicrobiota bacterium]